MSVLKGQVGELSFTVTVKRKETGKEETFNLVGIIDAEQIKELTNGSHPLDSSEKRGD